MRRFLEVMANAVACMLIVLLPGCSALLPWLAGEDADVAMIERDLDGIKEWVKEADANKDGLLSRNEGLIAAAGTLATAIWGVNYVRDRKRRQRGEPVDPVARPPAG